MFGKKKESLPKSHGIKMLVLGILIVLNAKYIWFDWATFIGGLLAIAGLVHLVMPNCPICK